MSFDAELAPSFDLRCLSDQQGTPDGWGLGYYPAGEPAAGVLKEPAPRRGSIRSELVKSWDHLASRTFLLHIRHAMWGQPTDANTQPFVRSYAGRDWMFAHSGSLVRRPPEREHTRFEAVGSTDTERVFCELLDRIAARGFRSLKDADAVELQSWFDAFAQLGNLTSVLCDGTQLCVYAGRSEGASVLIADVLPPYSKAAFGDDDLYVDLTRREVRSHRGVIVSSDVLAAEADLSLTWRRLAPGELLLIGGGKVLVDVSPNTEVTPPSVRVHTVPLPRRAEPKRLSLSHRSVYRYDKPVERSTHLLRLEPVHDRLQQLVEYELTVSVDGQERRYEDVFGNQARRIALETPFDELVIDSRAEVLALDTDPLSFRPIHQRSAIPLVWMPWQRQVLNPYLLPAELPETELHELAEYAMALVERNGYDLLDTLVDMNSTIFEEYEYRQGATNLHTTPFEVYSNRFGVCQDFANLFICLARLLGVPARYVCGYLYTGPKHENAAQGEASHAWVQVYLPQVGWKGFDPTNGVLTQTDHVRVAVGRNYVDATPTSGTIYVGGGEETLSVDVRVTLVD